MDGCLGGDFSLTALSFLWLYFKSQTPSPFKKCFVITLIEAMTGQNFSQCVSSPGDSKLQERILHF